MKIVSHKVTTESVQNHRCEIYQGDEMFYCEFWFKDGRMIDHGIMDVYGAWPSVKQQRKIIKFAMKTWGK